MFGGAKKKDRRPRPDGGGGQQTRENLQNIFGMPQGSDSTENLNSLSFSLTMACGFYSTDSTHFHSISFLDLGEFEIRADVAKKFTERGCVKMKT